MFLTEILANGPVDVLEMERQAGAAALLADDKRLNESKPFRQARNQVGFVSLREGFIKSQRDAVHDNWSFRFAWKSAQKL
jgi:hypothetical protein